jgi:hypothetical protein
MATERFNRQFILLDFEDLDNPEYMEFVRSPEFATYLVMRRYIWRSEQPHRLGLHEYYAQGLLACAVSREKLAEAVGNVSARQITRDISSLLNRNVIQSVATGRGNIFVLGKWGTDPEDNVYYEYFFLDKLHKRDQQAPEDPDAPEDDFPSAPTRDRDTQEARLGGNVGCPGRVDKNVHSEWTSNVATGQKCPGRVDTNVQSEWTFLSTNNIETNKERNREFSNISKGPDRPVSISSLDMPEEELSSLELETLIETCSREFDDMQHLESNLTRAFNLWARTRLDEAGMLARAREARAVTKRQVSSSAVRDRGKRMAYFFAVLEGMLKLREPG